MSTVFIRPCLLASSAMSSSSLLPLLDLSSSQSLDCGQQRQQQKFLHNTPCLLWDGLLQHRLAQGHRNYKNQPRDRKPIRGYNFIKGTVLKVVVKHPKKPNSGNRSCAIVRLHNGVECTAYIPGEGHNLQEHSQVRVRGGRRRDLIGVRANILRGEIGRAHV